MHYSACSKFIGSFVFFMSFMASAHDFTMKNVTHPLFSYSNFPILSSDKYSQSASNINTYLQYEFFERPFREEDFSNAALNPFREKDDNHRLFYIYDIAMQQATNYVTVSINGESCGAYCENFNNHYMFDVYSGRVITLIDVLSPQGVKALGSKIRAENLKRIEPYIQTKPPEGADDYVQGEFFLYKECYESLVSNPNYHAVNQKTSFQFSHEGLKVTNGRCSNHASRALDEIGDFITSFTMKSLQPYLSEEGQRYLSNTVYRLPYIKTPHKVMHGKIANKYAITLVKPKYGYWVYWYDKYGLPIELHEKTKNEGEELTFKEGVYSDAENKWVYTAEWKIKKQHDAFSGEFIRLSDGKAMTVYFK